MTIRDQVVFHSCCLVSAGSSCFELWNEPWIEPEFVKDYIKPW